MAFLGALLYCFYRVLRLHSEHELRWRVGFSAQERHTIGALVHEHEAINVCHSRGHPKRVHDSRAWYATRRDTLMGW